MRIYSIAAKYILLHRVMHRRGLALLCFIILCLSILSCEKKWDNPADPQVKLDPPIVTVLSETDEAVRIALSHSLGDKVKIYYTLDGSEPDSGSDLYVDEIEVPKPFPLKAIALADQNTSNCISAEYLLIVSTPIFSLSSGTFFDIIRVEISCSTMDVQIRYTTDGSEPSENSTLYSSTIDITQSTTLKAKAFRNGWNASVTAVAEYNFSFIFVEGGTFNNGTSEVTLSSFYIDKYEVTQAAYEAVMEVNPSNFAGYPNRPVERVSWFNAIEYCNRRSIEEGLTPCYSYDTFGTNPDNWTGTWNSDSNNHTNVSCNWTANGYRLPTEAEWMFAAKGGNQSLGYTYSGSNDINAVAWYSSNSGSRTHDVGELASNECGTFDMSGNVWERCWDIYGTYPSASQTNPTGASSGSYRVGRGGSWAWGANFCTVSSRSTDGATDSYDNLGFRLCRSSP